MKVFKEKLLPMFPYAIFLLVGGFLLIRPIMDGDEIWNYNFARNICEGRLPYVDFNMVPTPLSAYLAAGFLKVFGNTLFHFRIVAILLMAAVFGSLYYLCSQILQDKVVAFVSTVFVFGLNYLFWNYNYNNLNLLLIVMILCVVWKKNKTEGKDCVVWDILLGVLVGIMPLIKQSTGFVFLAINGVLCIYDIIHERKMWKQKMVRIAVSFVPGVCFVGTLLVQNSMAEFWDYAVAGIGTFNHKITYFEFLLSTPITFFIGIFPVFVVGMCIYSVIKQKEQRKLIATFLLWAIGGLIVAYPLCDSIHMVVAIVPFVPCVFLICKIKKLKQYEGYICCVVAALVLSVLAISDADKDGNYKKCELDYFRGSPIDVTMEEHIANVTDYIKKQELNGKKVVVCDEYGALYSIVLNHCNKDFDMLNMGNFGTKTISEILEPYQDDIILVRRDENNMGYQAYKELIFEVKNTYEKIDEVSSFDAYIRKKEN